MKVIFSHGKESGPWGRKIKRLAQSAQDLGVEVDSIDYTATLNPDVRVEMLDKLLASESSPPILVGSSMGGYVSLVNASNHQVPGLFLMAPALYMPNYQMQQYEIDGYCEIVHGWADDIIPVANSIKFAQQNHASLHVIEGDHSLNAALDRVDQLFRQFLSNL
ncbi:YqiA/YcfP family alpha/beta fold hydrolase [Paraglaciecola aestuariivivens]